MVESTPEQRRAGLVERLTAAVQGSGAGCIYDPALAAETVLSLMGEGADFSDPEPGVQRSPGQVLGLLLRLPGPERIDLLGRLLGAAEDGFACSMLDRIKAGEFGALPSGGGS